MIARLPQCPSEQLRDLLEDRLAPQQTAAMEDHLSSCSSCQQRLQSLAGGETWWTETGAALSDDPALSRLSSEPGPAVDARWIKPLLEASDRPDAWGRIADCDILGWVGQGGMGTVLRGWDANLNRPLAIKLLLPHLATSGPARTRFLREAQAAAAVVHPNVVPIYGVSQHGPLPHLVMPLVTGGNLQQRLDAEGPLELEEILRIGLQIAEGLAAAHRQGVVHRDIKPANILLEDGGRRVLISDFGLARALDDASLTASGIIAGTPQYMSPEQANGAVVDHRADIYSLGGLLYALATCRPPVAAGSGPHVLRNTGTAPRAAAHEINERLPVWFDRLIRLLMEPSPDRRPQTSEEVARLLQQCLAHLRAPGRAPLPAPVRPRRANRRSAIAFLGFLAAVIPLAFFLVFSGSSPPRPLKPPNRAKPTTANDTLDASTAKALYTAEPTPPRSADEAPSAPPPTANSLEDGGRDIDQALRRIELELERLRSEMESSGR